MTTNERRLTLTRSEAATDDTSNANTTSVPTADESRAAAWAAVNAARGLWDAPAPRRCDGCDGPRIVRRHRHCSKCLRDLVAGLDRRRAAELRMPPLSSWRWAS